MGKSDTTTAATTGAGTASTGTASTGTASTAAAVAAANRDHGVDFTDGRAVVRDTAPRGTWPARLTELREGVERGDGDYDTFYRIGEFEAASGARTCMRRLVQRGLEEVDGDFDLEPRIVTRGDGGRGSELWAAVIRP